MIGALEAEIEAEPFRERLRAVLMLALARAGRPVEALRAFDAYRGLLADEVGVVPSAALQELNDDILRQHPDLGWARTSRSAPAVGRAADGDGDLPVHRSRGFDAAVAGTSRRDGRALARHDAILRDAVEAHHGRDRQDHR